MMPYDSLRASLTRHADEMRRLRTSIGFEICEVLGVLEDVRRHASDELLASPLSVDELSQASNMLVKAVPELACVTLEKPWTPRTVSVSQRELAAGIVDDVSARLRAMLRTSAVIDLHWDMERKTVTVEARTMNGDILVAATAHETSLRTECGEFKREMAYSVAHALRGVLEKQEEAAE